MLIETVIAEFLADGKYRKLSDKTNRIYTYVLKNFYNFCKTQDQIDFEKVDSNLLKKYALFLQEVKANSTGGVAFQFRVVRALFGYANREDIPNTQPFKRFRMPKVDLPVMQFIDRNEYEVLIAASRGSDKPMRDSSIISILYDTGIRVGELQNLCSQDVLGDRGMLLVRGKTGERLVPVSRHVLKRLGQYVAHERPASQIANIFLTDAQTVMTYHAVALMLQRTSKRAGVKYKSPHCFRRGYVTQMVKNGADLFHVQRALGHKTLVMTNRYAVLNEDSLKAVHLIASPTRK
jgi:integrase/recombinase XerD